VNLINVLTNKISNMFPLSFKIDLNEFRMRSMTVIFSNEWGSFFTNTC